MEHEGFATELLRMVKVNARMWFIIAMVELCAIISMIIIFFVLPNETYTETEYSQEVEDITDSEITQHIGDKYYGESETNGN